MIRRRMWVTVGLAALSCLAFVSVMGAQSGAQDEDLARRKYENGLLFLQKQNYPEALKDFQELVDLYPNSGVASEALVEMARYYLEVAHDPAAAQAKTDTILKPGSKYAQSEAAPVAYVLNGRIALEKGRTPPEVEAALATFERVPGLFPGSAAIPSSIFYAGEALRAVQRNEDAISSYQRVTLMYPGSEWARRALLGLAMCLTQTGHPGNAIEALQHLRQDFAGTPEAATALKWNTILYRLYVRPPGQPAFGFSGQTLGGATMKFKDPIAMAIDKADNVLVAHKTGISVIDAKGAAVRSIPAENPSAFLLTPGGLPVYVRASALYPEGGRPLALTAAQANGQAKPVEEIPAALATASGDWLVADRKGKSILAFSSAGKFLKPFASSILAVRLAQNGLGDVAALDREANAVTLFDLHGKVLGKIAARGTGYELQDPTDVAFDTLGHLYVLDRAKASVFVFGPLGKFITSVSIPEKSPGALSRAVAFDLDSAGRLFVLDDRTQSIQVYQ